MGEILGSGQNMVVPSTMFNFVKILNDSPYSLDITAMHDDIGNPAIIIRNAVKKEATEEDKAIEKRLKNLEGTEVGK